MEERNSHDHLDLAIRIGVAHGDATGVQGSRQALARTLQHFCTSTTALQWSSCPKEDFEMNAKKIISYILAAMAIAVLASACMQEAVPGDETEVGEGVLPEESDELAAIEAYELVVIEGDELAMSFDEGQAGEAFDEDTTDDANVAAHCVYVEYCNVPGSGTHARCQLRSGCGCSNAALNECAGDVKAVCGRKDVIHFPDCGVWLVR